VTPVEREAVWENDIVATPERLAVEVALPTRVPVCLDCDFVIVEVTVSVASTDEVAERVNAAGDDVVVTDVDSVDEFTAPERVRDPVRLSVASGVADGVGRTSCVRVGEGDSEYSSLAVSVLL
jgi:hypothetical protein